MQSVAQKYINNRTIFKQYDLNDSSALTYLRTANANRKSFIAIGTSLSIIE